MTRIYRTEADVERVGLGLLDRSLPKPEWSHAGHFAATLWLLRHRPDLALETAMPPLIRAYNEATGVANTDEGGYHETITLASIAAARAFLARQADAALHEVADRLVDGPLGRPEWLLAYWSKATLFSVCARQRWTEPDLKPFDPLAIS
jgi:hypothetical protein